MENTAIAKICFIAQVDACSSTPCENGGSCIDVNVDAFVSVCRDGFFGVTCRESKSNLTFCEKYLTHGALYCMIQ